MKGKLVLEDGSIFYGELVTMAGSMGEVVFNTQMTGYQEVLTDPACCGQIVVFAYPLIGNCGVSAAFAQAGRSFVQGLVVSELSPRARNWQAEGTLLDYFQEQGIPCLTGVDTRAITRHLRRQGTLRGIISAADVNVAETGACFTEVCGENLVDEVTVQQAYELPTTGPRVVVIDYGTTRGILRYLQRLGYSLIVVPAHTAVKAILAYNPDGIVLSNGPGNPKGMPKAIGIIRELIKAKPIVGIGLGHLLLALALGGDTYRLKVGHRGANHPVRNLLTGKVYVTVQNHGFAVDEASIAGKELIVTHRAVNDGTVEGMRHRYLPIFSVQYYPDTAPDSADTQLFNEFLTVLRKGA